MVEAIKEHCAQKVNLLDVTKLVCASKEGTEMERGDKPKTTMEVNKNACKSLRTVIKEPFSE